MTTREQILREATSLFADKGYRGSSTATIAERVGVAHGTVFHHFKTKERLLIEIGETLIQRYLGGLQSLDDAGLSGWAALDQALRYHFSFLAGNSQGVFVVVHEYPRVLHRSRNEEHFRAIGEMVAKINAIRAGLIERGQADGSIRKCPVDMTVFMIDSLLSGIVHAQVGQHIPIPEDLAEQTIAFCRRSLWHDA